MKRLLIVTEAGTVSPSGWVRALIYKDNLENCGISVRYVSRQPEGLARIVNRQWALGRFMYHFNAVGALLARASAKVANLRENAIVRMARDGYDVIYLQKVCSLSLLRRLRKETKARLIFDLNDGLWLPANRGFFRDGNLEQILSGVDAVTCDNPYGVKHAEKFCHDVYLVPDPSQVEEFDKIRPLVTKPVDKVVIGWIGSPGTLFNLFKIWEALERVFVAEPGVSLRIIGVGEDRQLLPRFENVRYTTMARYSTNEMMQEVLRMHIGLFPLFNVDDSRARGILKAEIYMSGETAVIASPVGQCRDIIQDGVNGMLAHNTAMWIEQLLRLVRDASLRQRVARAGLETARQDFSLAATSERLIEALALN
ncbi:conserved hypothetical protein [Gammaproteobacteria bacterium]